MKLNFFTPGPAELYPTFEKHMRTFMDQQLGSISHRSQQYRDLHKFTVEQLRILLNVPSTHQLLFLGSASEAWERILLSCVEHESFHLVNGSFSKKFYEYSVALNRFAHKQEKPLGEGFDYKEIQVAPYAEVIGLAQNETSSGVQLKVSEIHKLKKDFPEKIIAVDMVSSAPHPDLDYSLIDTSFFSIQKAFGLPAGLGVWIVNEKCLEKAEQLKATEGVSIGAHHDLPTLWKNATKFETPSTPNVPAIYLLGKIAEDMNTVGVEKIREQTETKAKMLYRFLEKQAGFEPFVKKEAHRSSTVVVANTEQPSKEIISALKEKGMVVGSGYGSYKDTQIRIANFPATPVEKVEQLIDALGKL